MAASQPSDNSCEPGASVPLVAAKRVERADEHEATVPHTRGEKAAAENAEPGRLSWAPEHRLILCALLGVACLLVAGPSTYYLGATPARQEVADKYRANAHGAAGADQCYSCQASSSRHRATALSIDRAYANEVVSGGLNGLLLLITTVMGGIGADLPSHGILAIGAANLLAYGSSLGFGSLVVELAKDEFSMSQLMEEYQEVRTMPEQEINEMVCLYKSRGLTEEDARTVANLLSKYEDYWVHHMMAEELGVELPRGRASAAASVAASALSFAGFGMVPLLGVIVPMLLRRIMGPQWYRPQFSTMIAMAVSAVALALLGIFLSLVVGSRATLTNGLLLLGTGCAASVLALCIGEACKSIAVVRKRRAEEPSAPPNGNNACGDGASSPFSRSMSLSRYPSENPQYSAWPSFRRHFFLSLALLWAVVCTCISAPHFLERAGYNSLRVFAYGTLTCITTGLGALPFAVVRPESVDDKAMAAANAAASGMMLAASAGMLLEAHEHSGTGDWQLLVGLAAGGLFIKVSEWLHGNEEGETDVEVLHTALVEQRHFRKAMLIFTVMFFHSAAEGIAVGVAFSKQLRAQFGLYVSLLLAVHNIPEGLAVALVLVPRGVSTMLAGGIAVLTSVPQPLLAVVAYLFVDGFKWLLPLGLAFAAGAMVYVCFHELLAEAAEHMGWQAAAMVTGASFVVMSAIQYALQASTGL